MNKVIMESDVDIGDIVYIEHKEVEIIKINYSRYKNTSNGISELKTYSFGDGILRQRHMFKTKKQYRDYLIDKVNELGEDLC